MLRYGKRPPRAAVRAGPGSRAAGPRHRVRGQHAARLPRPLEGVPGVGRGARLQLCAGVPRNRGGPLGRCRRAQGVPLRHRTSWTSSSMPALPWRGPAPAAPTVPDPLRDRSTVRRTAARYCAAARDMPPDARKRPVLRSRAGMYGTAAWATATACPSRPRLANGACTPSAWPACSVAAGASRPR